jgi:hypothetical protein
VADLTHHPEETLMPRHDFPLQPMADKLAKMLACHGGRYSALAVLHAGTLPSSQTGDYTDVKVLSPYGEIAWNRVGRISDEAMQPLMEESVDRLYTFLVLLLDRGEPEHGLPQPKNWSAPQMQVEIARMWDGYGHA